MNWKEYPKNKPESDCTCYITCQKAGLYCYLALYDKHWDVFKLYDPSVYYHPALEVSHYIELPYAPM